jgi:hypothetical protein
MGSTLTFMALCWLACENPQYIYKLERWMANGLDRYTIVGTAFYVR